MDAKKIKLFMFIAAMIAWGVGFYSWKTVAQLQKDVRQEAIEFSMNDVKDIKEFNPIVIIGSGCAGWSSAIYAARGGVPTLVIEGSKPGGQLSGTTDVENFPGIMKDLGPEIMARLKNQAVQFGAQVLNDTVTEVSLDSWPYTLKTQEGRTIKALTIIVATGASPRTLGIPGEQEYWGKGLTTCAICDAAFHEGNDVVVIGGGDSAVEQVLQLTPYAKTVTMIVRADKLRASVAMQKRLAEIPKVNILYNTNLVCVEGDGTKVKNVKLQNNKTQEVTQKEVSGVFLAIGHDPNTTLFQGKLDLDSQGYILMKDRSQRTSQEGVFAAGDVEDHVYRQAGVASGSGIKAALDALSFLREIGCTDEHCKGIKLSFNKVEPVESITLTSIGSIQEFQSALQGDKAVVVDFYTQHCPTCKQMEKSILSYAPQVADKATFLRIDAGALKEVANEYHILNVPALLIFKNGALVARYNSKSTEKVVDFMQHAIS